MRLTDKEKQAARILARKDLYFFSRYMFLTRKGYAWQQSPHHKIICDKLMQVYNGEIKNLIINLPPRYSKTELAVVNFIAWALGNYADCEFIHSSYSATLAVNNSSQIRDLLQNEEYQAIFNTRLKDDSKSKDHWKTTSGGVMYATGAGGTITGFGAGKLRDGFGGCFPFDAKVWTEKGLMCIGDIVTKKMQVNVWAYDYNGNIVLKPITAWHKNPPNSIIRVGFSDGTTVECTPCHKLWTNNRGWVRADSLTKNDILPCVNSRIKTFNDIFVKAKSFGSRSQSKTIFTTSSISSIIQSNIALLFAKLGSKVSVSSSLFSGFATTGYRFPRSATPYTLNDANINIVASSKFSSWYARSVIYFNNLSVSKLGTRVDFSFAKSFVNFAIDNIGSPCVVTQIFKPIIKRVAVTVANISTNWSLSNKSKHDETVNKYGFNLSVFGKVYTQVSMCIGGRFKQLAFKRSGFLNTTIKNSSIFASNIANIANTIKPFIRGNRQPTFIEYVRHDNQTFCLTVESYHNFIINSGLVVKNCIILDDPHKADEARSETMRSNVINWFTETIKSRRNDPSKTPIIIIMQRLHESDLSGYLLAGNDDDDWQHLKLPAIQADGTALWAQKHSIDKLHQMQIASPYMFAGQYMQEPAPLDGGVFKPSNIEIIDAVPQGNIKWVRGWDLGATVGGDPTAGVKLGTLPDGRLVIADIVHGDVSSDDRDRMMKNTASQDGKGVLISIPQDPGQAGKTQVQYLVKLLQGYKVHTSTETGDKVTRAEPIASQVNVGNVVMVRGAWNDAFLDEMRMFPNGARDDRIDGLSRAYSRLIDSIFSYDNV